MTINIALVTRESVILGCDSLSSASDYALFPYRDGQKFAVDGNGNEILDANGHKVIAVDPNNVEQIATTVVGGARKMFCIYRGAETNVAAVTSGQATILGETIADMAKRFLRENTRNGTEFSKVGDVAKAFYDFARARWEQDVDFEHVPEIVRQYLPTLQFLVGGIGVDDDTGQVFRLDLKAEQCERQFAKQGYGVCWAGQSEFAQRLIKGIDLTSMITINREIIKSLESQRSATLAAVGEALLKANIDIPEGTEFEVEEIIQPSIPYDAGVVNVDFANLSNQYAVEFVSLLVNTQSGMQRFANGIATVGGRTHIGIIERGETLRMLNDPALMHVNTGYGDG